MAASGFHEHVINGSVAVFRFDEDFALDAEAVSHCIHTDRQTYIRMHPMRSVLYLEISSREGTVKVSRN